MQPARLVTLRYRLAASGGFRSVGLQFIIRLTENELRKELGKPRFALQAAAYLFRSHLIADTRQLLLLPVGLSMRHQFHRTRHNRLNGDRRACRQPSVYRRVDMEERIAGIEAGFDRAFCRVLSTRGCQ